MGGHFVRFQEVDIESSYISFDIADFSFAKFALASFKQGNYCGGADHKLTERLRPFQNKELNNNKAKNVQYLVMLKKLNSF